MRGGRDIVETDDRDVLGHAQAAREAHAQRGERGGVVVGKHGVGARAGRVEQTMHRARGAGVGVEARVDRQFQRRIEQQPRFEERACR